MGETQRKAPSPPDSLENSGREFWTEILEQYELRPDERRILRDACHEMDLIERMQAEQAENELTALGYNGQPVPAPLVGELRQHRATLTQMLAKLKLPDSAAGTAQKKAHTSEQARAAARARWGTAKGA